MEWTKTNELYEGTTPKFEYKNKIASFDLDGTLITPINPKKKFSENSSDWVWAFDTVPDKIKELIKDEFCIVIISNQAGIKDGKANGEEWCKKIESIVNKLNCEMKVFCSISKNKYRKPIPTFYTEFFPKKNSSQSFYCGDACGRKQDFADTDLKFALNCNLKFYIPEHLFLKHENTYPKIDYCFDFNNKKEFKLNFTPKEKEMLIMVGYQGSGKSFVSQFISEKYDYDIINRDTEKTEAKCIKKTKDLLKQKKNIIIDNTNPSKEKRKIWIDLAKENGYSVKLLHMNTDINLAKHNNIYRSLTKDIDLIPDIAYNMYKSKYEKPTSEEGFEDIIYIEPSYPNDENYYKYLV